jgi:hypothetical protein
MYVFGLTSVNFIQTQWMILIAIYVAALKMLGLLEIYCSILTKKTAHDTTMVVLLF